MILVRSRCLLVCRNDGCFRSWRTGLYIVRGGRLEEAARLVLLCAGVWGGVSCGGDAIVMIVRIVISGLIVWCIGLVYCSKFEIDPILCTDSAVCAVGAGRGLKSRMLG